MLACHYSDIQRIAARLAGLPFPLGEEEAVFRVSVDRHLHDVKSLALWPELNPVEARLYTRVWASGTADAAGDFVFFNQTQLYYQCLVAGTGNPPADSSGVLDTTKWALAATSFSATNWDASTVYAGGSITYYPTTDTFYAAIFNNVSGHLPTALGYWRPLVAFVPAISLDQDGQTPIGEVTAVWNANPRVFTRAKKVAWELTDNGIQVIDGPVKVWVEFTIRLSRLIGEPWSATATYTFGEQVQFSVTQNGVEVIDFYNCGGDAPASADSLITEEGEIRVLEPETAEGDSPASAPLLWELVKIPDIFRNYLGAKAAMDLLSGDSDPLFQKADQEADRALERLFDQLYRVQHQVPTGNVLVYA